MGPLDARLPLWAAAGKPMGKVAGRERAVDAPAGRDAGEGLKDEAAPCELSVRDGETARAKLPTAPQCNVEVEHTRAPAQARSAAEGALDVLEALKHLGRPKVAFDQGYGVGEVAAGTPVRGVQNDRRGIEKAELLVEPGDRRLHDTRWTAVTAVRAVGADRDGVQVVSQTTTRSP